MFEPLQRICVLLTMGHTESMTMSQIASAMERQVPFTLSMADGKEYRVPHSDYISIPPKGAFVVVYDDSEHAFVLPLLTMTGLSYDSSELNQGQGVEQGH